MRSTWLWILAACGAPHAVETDAADEPDAVAPDTAPPDAASTTVALTVISHDAPAPGILVHFQNADSSLVASLETDATGTAEVEMAAGGFVTLAVPAADPQNPPFLVWTWAGVKPGDHMRVVLNTDAVPETHMSLSVPPPTNPNDSFIYTACGASTSVPGHGPWPSLPFYSGGASTCQLLMTALDDTGTLHEALYAADVPITEGGSVTLAGAYQPYIAAHYMFTGLPGTMTSLSVETSISTSKGPLGSLPDPTRLPISQGTASGTVLLPPVTGTARMRSRFFLQNDFQWVDDWSPISSAHTVNVGAALVTPFASGPAIDAAAHTVTWTIGTGGQTPDLASAQLQILRGDRVWRWTVVEPYSSPVVTFPVLPDMPFDYNPERGDSVSLADVRTMRVPGGYDAARAHYFSGGIQQTGATGQIVDQHYAVAGNL
jgi:hypothetical protein